jgi:hypothetical protein
LPGRSGGIISTSFGFHFGWRSLTKLEAAPLLTTKQLQDSQIPFSGDWRCQGGSVRFNSALNYLRHPENRYHEIDL